MSIKSWWKSLFREPDVSNFGLPKVTCDVPMPEVKPPKLEKDISEPVYKLMAIFQKNPKRFKFSYGIWEEDELGGLCIQVLYGGNYYTGVDITVLDSHTKEKWVFTAKIMFSCIAEWERGRFSKFPRHKIYPVLGYKLREKPNWLTKQELDYIEEIWNPYFLERVIRYREIVNYRKERREESHKRKTELDKKKERERLVNVYKGE